MASIGDILLRIVADDKGFAADLTKKAGAAGDQAGRTLGQRMGQAARVGLTATGAAAGAVLGIAAKAGGDLTNAMAEFQRETGATQAELASAQASVVELSRSNLQSFDQIARAQAALRTDLGLTQAEAEAATEQFLDYANATGRDATEGVTALDDILDAFQLDASKSGEIMDKLVASHQEYGGSISENEAALAKMAPQLQALNLDVDDGIGLLNLFAASGLDAASGQKALNSAITKLPEGESLDEFIARLSTVEDDGERARLAIEVFGTRGGAGLANAIQPGVDSLADFQVSMSEAEGATTEASDAIKNTPVNQLTLAFKNLIGPLAEAGTHFAPLILALTQLGGGKLIAGVAAGLGGLAGKVLPKLTGALAGLFGKAATSAVVEGGAGAIGDMTAKQISKRLAGTAATGLIGDGLASGLEGAGKTGRLKGAMSKLGGLLGSPLGLALGAAAAIAAAAVLFDDLMKLTAENDRQLKDIGANVGNQVAQGSLEALQQSKAALEKGIKDLWIIEGFLSLDADAQMELQRQLDAVNAAIAERTAAGAAAVPPAVADELVAGAAEVRAAADTMGEGIVGGVEAAVAAAGEAAENTPEAIADGILSEQGAVEDAMAALQRQMEEEVTGSKAAWDTIGTLVGEELAEGLDDSRPGVKAVAEDVVDTSVEELEKFIEGGGKIGDKAMAKLRDAIKNGTPQQQAAAQHIVDLVEGTLDDLPPAGTVTGEQLTANLRSGIRGSSGSITSAATAIANAARNGVTQYNDNAATWGTNFVRAFAAGMTVSRAIGAVVSAGNTVANVLANILKPGSPPKEGPAHTLDEWFPGLMRVFVSPRNVREGYRIVSRGTGQAMRGMAAGTLDSRQWTPVSTVSYLASVAPSTAARGEAVGSSDGDKDCGCGNTTVNVQGALPVETVRDITTELRAVRERRLLPGRRRREPLYPARHR